MKKKKKTLKDPGYPNYSPKNDIYKKGIKDDDIEIEELSKTKTPIKNIKKKKIDESISLIGDSAMSVPGIAAEDLDIPGSELDDNEEIVGTEDEENNYYSTGGDKHEDLEEDKS